MKKIISISTVIIFAFIANVSAQLKVDATGQVGIGTANPQYKLDVVGNTRIAGNIYLGGDSNIIATTNNVPITFKMNGTLAGSTGNTGDYNVSFGYGALTSNTTGSENTAIGRYALYSNTIGNSNTANGISALSSNTTGGGNTAIGVYTLVNNTVGSSNTATGVHALLYNTTGGENTATGVSALRFNTSGGYNIATGNYALCENTTGSNNTANGWEALRYNTTGSYNIANGYYTLFSNGTGHYNIAIGSYANANATNLNNTTAIGYSASTTSSNQVRIGNGSITSIGGYADWTNFSDKRAKKNIREDVPGLSFINQLQPVTYNLDLDAIDGLLKIDKTKRPGKENLSPELIDIEKKAREAKEKQIQTGFLAQDVEKVAKSIGYDFSGVDVDEIGVYGLRYAEFVVPLVKAVQELSAQVNELTALVNSLQGKGLESGALKSGSVAESTTGLQDLTANGASLQQNIPNPFNQSSVIRYTLPQTCKSAQIVITNPAGNVVRQIPLSIYSGTDSITIEGGALSAGIYHYSLYVDGSLVDTKQMILTK